MSLSIQQPIEDYVREISDMMVPVTVVVNETREIPNCLLLYRPGSKDKRELIIKARPGKYPESGKVRLTCAYSQSLVIFQSTIIGTKKAGSGHIYLRIKFPDKVVKTERRRFARVKPSEKEPVYVKFLLDNKKTVTVEAMDIGGGGISCVLPDNLSKFKKGNSFHLSLTFPLFSEIPVWVTVLSTSRLFNMARVNMAYSVMSEYSHSIIMSYIALRGREMNDESQKIKPAISFNKANIFFIGQNRFHKKYAFLKNIFTVFKSDFAGATAGLSANPPELIILNDDTRYALNIINMIKADKILKNIPLVVLTKKIQSEDERLKYAVVINTPFHERLLVHTAKQLVEQYRQSKNIRIKFLTTVSDKGNRVFIIDRFRNFSRNSIKVLTDYGFNVTVLRNENIILKKTEQLHPDIIIIDEEMEKTNPVSLCRSINMNGSIKAIPRIIVTANRKNYNRFYSQGFFAGFIAKPVNPEKLLTRVFETIPQ